MLLMGRRLAAPLAAAAIAGGAALGALALASTVLVAVVLLILIGASRVVQSVAAQTLLQRSTPLDVMVCVFALIESMRDLGMAAGAMMVPLLIQLGGAPAAFAGMACISPLAVLAAARRIRVIDEDASIPVVEMGVLRNTPIFSALPGASLETLAREARYSNAPTGTRIVTEGEQGDLYYTITDGSVVVTKGDREIRRMGSGEGFGEIALLRTATRTASVIAASDTTVLAVGRDAFLTAMRAHPAVTAAAADVAAGLLDHAG
jgi:hypothetical protein